MTFDELLEQTIALLQRRGRMSYRALKRQFHLDDAYLEDLTLELIEVHRVAVDHDGTMLVWTGTPLAPTSATTRQEQTTSLASARQDMSPSPPEAERRQLTVMFCDLADSTALAGQLDPEDYRAVVRAYQEAGAAVMQRHDGYIAQYLGDALLVYFGWPQAHEDDAQRAVRAGLALLDTLQPLNARLASTYGVSLAVRVGIHTGLVVVGEMGGGERLEHLALGAVPNVASRIQGLAATNTVAVSATTARLVEGYFTLDDGGLHTLKGVAEPMRVWWVRGETETRTRFEVATRRGLTPLVGREEEVVLLRRRWQQSEAGQGQVVLLSGEGGIGKSRLTEMLRQQVAQAGARRMTFRCTPYHTNSALYPVIAHLQRLLGWQGEATAEGTLTRLEQALQTSGLPLAEGVPLLATLLSLPLPERYPPLTLTPQRQRQQTMEMLVRWLLAEAMQQPTLVVWEDLHWADPSSVELLSLLIERTTTARMLVLGTFRPDFQPPWPLTAHFTQLNLNRCDAEQIARIATHVAGGKTLPTEVMQQLVTQTDGVPLFVEELTKTVLEAGILHEHEQHYVLSGPLPTLAIPATLQDALLARLDRLDSAKGVAQLGAVIGRQFPYALLHAVVQRPETEVQRELDRLVTAELLYQRGMPPQAVYTFKHALIQDAAYHSLLKSTRQQYHQRIAETLVRQFADTVTLQPELLAQHYTEAGATALAIDFWYAAGQRALERSASVEAVAHLRHGLALLSTLADESDTAQRELDLQWLLGQTLRVTQGYAAPEVEHVFARARELCQRVGNLSQLFPVVRGLGAFYYVRAEFQTARELGEQLLSLAQEQDEVELRLAAYSSICQTLLQLGDITQALHHAELAMTLYDSSVHQALAYRYGQDLGVHVYTVAAQSLWWLGYPDRALKRSQEACRLADGLAHSYSQSLGRFWKARVHLYRGEADVVQQHAEALIAFSIEQGFPFVLALSTILRGWALAAQGQGTEGIAQLQQGLAATSSTGGRATRSLYLSAGLGLRPAKSARTGPGHPRRSPGLRGGHRGALLGGRTVSAQGRIAPTTGRYAGARSYYLLPAGPGYRPGAASQVPGTACRNELSTPVAAAGQTPGGL
jgi:class 3 adenylate cyclase/tetratricopeptide (TPR) repeat protein